MGFTFCNAIIYLHHHFFHITFSFRDYTLLYLFSNFFVHIFTFFCLGCTFSMWSWGYTWGLLGRACGARHSYKRVGDMSFPRNCRHCCPPSGYSYFFFPLASFSIWLLICALQRCLGYGLSCAYFFLGIMGCATHIYVRS